MARRALPRDQVRKLKDPEAANARLRRVVSDLMLHKMFLADNSTEYQEAKRIREPVSDAQFLVVEGTIRDTHHFTR